MGTKKLEKMNVRISLQERYGKKKERRRKGNK